MKGQDKRNDLFIEEPEILIFKNGYFIPVKPGSKTASIDLNVPAGKPDSTDV